MRIRTSLFLWIGAVSAVILLAGQPARADQLTCNMSDYKASAGLTAVAADNILSLTWDGDKNEELRLLLTVKNGTPTIQDLAVRHKGGAWTILASNITGNRSWTR